MKFKSVMAMHRGGPEALQVVENDLRPPSAGEVRVGVLATPICQDDIAARVGNRPFLPRVPFVPGYTMIGVVDAIGQGVTQVAPGERVAALTKYGCHTEYIYWPEGKLVRVPISLDPAKAATLMLNYLVAYQAMHRVVRVKAGDKVLIVGASGGVGTAFLQLGKLAGLTMYGLASSSKHDFLTELGAKPIDYRTQDFVKVIREAEPQGIDFVFNGMAGEYLTRGLAVLRSGGTLVHYGAPTSFSGMLRLLGRFLWYNLVPNGKSVKGYGTHRMDHEILAEDWAKLFELLQDDKITPIIAAKFPILEAATASQLLESGQVLGNVVLLAPELL